MGKKKKNQVKKTRNPISKEEKDFLADLKKMGFKEKHTLGYILDRTMKKVSQINDLIMDEVRLTTNLLGNSEPHRIEEILLKLTSRIEESETKKMHIKKKL